MIEKKQCIQVVLNSHADYNKVYHLNTVNSLHSRLKEMMKQINIKSVQNFLFWSICNQFDFCLINRYINFLGGIFVVPRAV